MKMQNVEKKKSIKMYINRCRSVEKLDFREFRLAGVCLQVMRNVANFTLSRSRLASLV